MFQSRGPLQSGRRPRAVQEPAMKPVVIVAVAVGVLVGFAAAVAQERSAKPAHEDKTIRLGNFSVSLAVKDIAASRAFYEKLGFRALGGEQAKNWLILQNETSTIGLFQGMFEKNLLTFNPGWD